MALDMVQIYKSDAEMNGLEFDVHKEEKWLNFLHKISLSQVKFI